MLNGSAHLVWILLNKRVPARITFAKLHPARVVEVADRSGQPIGGIKVFGKGFQAQQTLKHTSYLFLAGISVAGNGHLDFFWGIFGHGHFSAQSGRHGDSLGTAQFQHGLDIFAKKWGFNGDFIGMKGFNEFDGPFKDQLQLHVRIVVLLELQLVQLEEAHLFVDHFYEAESHDGGAGVYSKYDFFGIQKLCIIAGLTKFTEGP